MLMPGACAGAMLIEVLIGGGVPNPLVQLGAAESARLCALPKAPAACAASEGLGFSGWRTPWGEILWGSEDANALLMAQPDFLGLSDTVRNHVRTEAARGAAACQSTKMSPDAAPAPKALGGSDQCTASPTQFVLGPDNPTKVVFAPECNATVCDDQGCFLGSSHQSDNNCYDYGNDIVTNTFAQPGRGSGKCSKTTRPCVPNDCDSVRAAAESDGLVWAGTTLPAALPSTGHYVSLHIWPRSNFHWIRMDANM